MNGLTVPLTSVPQRTGVMQTNKEVMGGTAPMVSLTGQQLIRPQVTRQRKIGSRFSGVPTTTHNGNPSYLMLPLNQVSARHRALRSRGLPSLPRRGVKARPKPNAPRRVIQLRLGKKAVQQPTAQRPTVQQSREEKKQAPNDESEEEEQQPQVQKVKFAPPSRGQVKNTVSLSGPPASRFFTQATKVANVNSL